MEEMLCAMALKSANGRLNHHTLSGLCVCCEWALKSAGERNSLHTTRSVRGPSGNRLHGGAWRGSVWHRWRRFGGGGSFPPAGKLLTGNIGSLCEQQPLKALRAPGGPISQYKILHYIIPPAIRDTRYTRFGVWCSTWLQLEWPDGQRSPTGLE
jgi:hypothetical protein